MLRLVWRQARLRAGRSIALMAGIVVATTGFTVLVGAIDRSTLVVTEAVEANARAAYDILVRPAAARSAEEQERGSVRPNYLSGLYGGISPEQWRTIRHIEGVETAAPIAMVGYAAAVATVRVDLTDIVDPSLERQVIRLRPTWTADSGLTTASEPAPRFAYVTRRPVAPTYSVRSADGQQRYVLPDGTERPLSELAKMGCTVAEVPYLYLEQDERGEWRPICGTWYLDYSAGGGTASLSPSQFFVLQALPDGEYLDFTRVSEALAGLGVSRSIEKPRRMARPSFEFDWPLWLSVAAVDPVEESHLVGLDKAVVEGGYLPAGSARLDPETTEVPALIPVGVPVAEQLTMAVDRIGGPMQVPGVSPAQLLATLAQAPATARDVKTYLAADVYAQALGAPETLVRLDITLQSAPPTYAVEDGGALRPATVEIDPAAWRTPISQFGEVATGADALQPYLANDVGFRSLSGSAMRDPADVLKPPRLRRVGVFDPARLTEFPSLSVVPQETYQTPTVVGADARSKQLLGDAALLPGNNPAGYLAAPPSILMPLDVAERLLERPDLISAVRVRVVGVTGIDAVSRERVRLVAEEIVNRTGLDVDVTIGSSPQPQLIHLPAGSFGRPDLALLEGWSKKGVAVTIVQAADRKSLLLSGSVLVVCLLFLVSALLAAVRDRHHDLAVLACLGWPPWRLAAIVLTEVGLIGAIAGLLSALASLLLGATFGTPTSWSQVGLAIPVALGMTIAAGLLPALRASRAHPGSALHPRAVVGRRSAHPRSIRGLAMANVGRSPGRTAMAAVSLATGVAGLLLLLAITWSFQGTVVGSLLGDAVSLRARAVDVFAVITTVVLSGLAVADVLYINLRERAAEFAVLQATGWNASAARRLVIYEAVYIGTIGGLLGSASGSLGIALLVGRLPSGVAGLGLLVALTAVLVAVVAAVVPVLSMRKQNLSAVLAEV